MDSPTDLHGRSTGVSRDITKASRLAGEMTLFFPALLSRDQLLSAPDVTVAPLTRNVSRSGRRPRINTRPASADCGDSLCSLMLLGCGPVTTSAALRLTGFVSCLRLVRSWSPAPAWSERLA